MMNIELKPINTIIVISGRISSGKSTVAKIISSKHSFPVASFGAYLKHYCESNGLPTDRKTLQDTGEDFVQRDPVNFLKTVVNHFIENSDILILEGVRHKIIFDEVQNICQRKLAIFVDADQNTRYKRYYDRNKDTEYSKTLEQFIESDNHIVEQGIDSLKSLCDIIIDSTKQFPEMQSNVEAFVENYLMK